VQGATRPLAAPSQLRRSMALADQIPKVAKLTFLALLLCCWAARGEESCQLASAKAAPLARQAPVLLQVQQRHSRAGRNEPDQLDGGASFSAACCAAGDWWDCVPLPWWKRWCGKSKTMCETFCRAAWFEPPKIVQANLSAPAQPLREVGLTCCLSAYNASDACGTCYPASWAAPGSMCASSEANCQTCSGGKGVWCAGGGRSATAAEPTSQPP